MAKKIFVRFFLFFFDQQKSWGTTQCVKRAQDMFNLILTCFGLLFCDCSWPSGFCRWAPSAPPLWPPGSAAETPPSSPSPACAVWWPLPAGKAEDGVDGRGNNKRKFKNTNACDSKTYSAILKQHTETMFVFVCVVPDLLSVGAPPVFPLVHCPCLRPREFSPPNPSGSHCEATHTNTHTHTFIKQLYQTLIY